MVFGDSYQFSLIFMGFGRFEALEVREPGATWGGLGQPGAAIHLPLFKQFTDYWMLGHFRLDAWALGT